MGTKHSFLIAGTHSGVGKTTISLGLMAAFRKMGLGVQPFKVGPDFIDPLFHRAVSRRVCANLDSWMINPETVQSLYEKRASTADVSVIEGVMGLFDGVHGESELGSSAHIAKLLRVPVILVLDAHAMSRSAGAIVLGFDRYDPDLNLAGVILNRVAGKGHAKALTDAIGRCSRVPVLGALPRESSIEIPRRHLGLTTDHCEGWIRTAAPTLIHLIERHIDMPLLLKISQAGPGVSTVKSLPLKTVNLLSRVRLGLALDEAFQFYYEDNLDLLREYGADLIPFSPVKDKTLPNDLSGLYIGGGYPEVFAEVLSKNIGLTSQILHMGNNGFPILAECGGLMYLSKELLDMDGRCHPMVGLIPIRIQMKARLSTLGYRKVSLARNTLLGTKGTQARGHEFHWSYIPSEQPSQKIGSHGMEFKPAFQNHAREGDRGYCSEHIVASYIHLHFASNPEIAENFVRICHNLRIKKV